MNSKDFTIWNVCKQNLHKRCHLKHVHIRDIWWCSIGTNVGIEIDGKNKFFERPVLILKKFNDESVLGVPMTSQPKIGKYYMPIRHKDRESILILSQIRMLSTRRLRVKMGRLEPLLFNQIVLRIKEELLA